MKANTLFTQNFDIKFNGLTISNRPSAKKKAAKLSYITPSGKEGHKIFRNAQEWYDNYTQLCTAANKHYKVTTINNFSIKTSQYALKLILDTCDQPIIMRSYVVTYAGTLKSGEFITKTKTFNDREEAIKAYKQICVYASKHTK